MKAIIKEKPEPGAVYAEVDTPVISDDEILFEVEAAAICGTDVHLYNWDSSAISFVENYSLSFPCTLGHEISGTIIEMGKNVAGKKLGDRISLETHIPCMECFQCQMGNMHNCNNMGLYGITYNGAFATYAKAPANVAFVLPDAISFEEGSMFEPASVAVHGVDNAAISMGEIVLVYGCGPIGLVAIQLAKASGAGKVIAIDKNDYRLAMAEKYGAIVLDTKKDDLRGMVAKLTGPRQGVDVVIELTGATQVYDTLFDLIRREGRLITVGHPAGSVPVNITRDVNQKGLSIKGVFGRSIWRSWRQLASLLENKKIDIASTVTHRFAFSKFEEAFKMTSGDAGKILFLK